jgi:hypothetical protein
LGDARVVHGNLLFRINGKKGHGFRVETLAVEAADG